MKSVFAFYNGKLYKEEDLPIDFRNRAFSMGDGLFESMHFANNKVQLFDYHIDRLRKGVQMYQMQAAFLSYPEFLHKDIVRLVNANRFFKAVRIRLQVFRRGAGLYTPETSEADYLITCQPLAVREYAWNEEGLKLGMFERFKKHTGEDYSFKSLNTFISVQASIFKQKMGFHNCFLINTDDKIIEASNANIFGLRGHTVFTPEVRSGCVAGVMRRHIMDLLKKNNYKIQEVTGFSPNEILNFDEIFISNAIEGIRWVVSFRNKRYYNSVTKEIYFLLNRSLLSD